VKEYKKRGHIVDVSSLTNVLSVSSDVVVAEGQVSMHQLCSQTLRHYRMPPVVPELSDFTCAGLVNGLGIQSSSHRYGLFPDSLISFEVILGDGSIVVASRDDPETSNLFFDLPGSYGTLGIVTAIAMRLIPAGPYVVSKYRLFKTLSSFDAALKDAVDQCHSEGSSESKKGCTFVEGYVYSSTVYVLVESEYKLHPSGLPIHNSNEPGAEWYHQHVESSGKRGGEAGFEDCLETLDYIFRLERGFWWFVEFTVGLKPFTETSFGRNLLDRAVEKQVKKLPTGINSWAGQSSNVNWTADDMHRCNVHQDMGVRLGRAEEIIRYNQIFLGVYPLWVCPFVVFGPKGALWNSGYGRVANAEVKAGRAQKTLTDAFLSETRKTANPSDPLPWHFPSLSSKPSSGFPLMACDIGVYGEPTVYGFKCRRDIRALQRLVDVPAFWGMSYLTSEELMETYDFKQYEASRKQYRAGKAEGGDSNAKAALLDIREKTSFFDPSKPDLGPIPLWRLHRAGLVPSPSFIAGCVATISLTAALLSQR
jgi:delta24-sterol reductase